MKKLLSLLLAVAMVLSVSVVAFASGETSGGGSSAVTITAGSNTVSNGGTLTINKSYTVNGTAATTPPSESLSLSFSLATSSDVEATSDTSSTLTATYDSSTKQFTITLPQYTGVGDFVYSITESGSVYSIDGTYWLHVQVLNDDTNTTSTTRAFTCNVTLRKGETALTTYSQDSTTKVAAITNNQVKGSLEVSKDVTGNFSSPSDEFTVNYTLTSTKAVVDAVSVGGTSIGASSFTKKDGETAWTYSRTAKVSESSSVTFADLPAGMSVTIQEDTTANNMNGYTIVKYTVDGTDASSTDAQTVAISENKKYTVKITNKKDATVDTGITLDSVPYIVMLAAVAACAVFFFARKRRTQE